MVPIETARLRLRRFVPGDVAALHAIHSRADVTRWLLWDPRPEDEVRASIEGHIARPLEQGAVLAIDLGGTLIGTVNVAVGESRQGRPRLPAPPRPPGSRLRDRGGLSDARPRVRRL
jgi:RimJ/RimL family protein N-acetyltransferase